MSINQQPAEMQEEIIKNAGIEIDFDKMELPNDEIINKVANAAKAFVTAYLAILLENDRLEELQKPEKIKETATNIVMGAAAIAMTMIKPILDTFDDAKKNEALQILDTTLRDALEDEIPNLYDWVDWAEFEKLLHQQEEPTLKVTKGCLATQKRSNTQVDRYTFNEDNSKEMIKGTLFKITTGEVKKNKQYVLLTLEMKRNLGETLDALDAFSRRVYYAVNSLFIDANPNWKNLEKVHPVAVTVEKIWRVMVGDPKARPNDETKKKIREALETMSKLSIRIDPTLEREGRWAKTLQDYPYEGMLLNIVRKPVRAENGKKVDGYIILSPSIIYIYAADKNQIIEVPTILLNVPGLRHTEDIDNLMDCLIWYINPMKYYHQKGEEWSDRILINSLLEDLGKSDIKGMAKTRLLEQCRMIFNHWKSIKYIKDWSDDHDDADIKAGARKNTVRSFKISLFDEE